MKDKKCSTQIFIKDFRKSDELKTTIRKKLEKYQALGCQLDQLKCEGHAIALRWKSN